MYKTDINKINISSTNFIDTEKLNDLIIGEDTNDLLVVNSDAIFTGTLTTSGGLVGGSSGGSSGIVNNRIDGDLTIGEDSSDLLVVNSEAKFVNNVNIGTEIGASISTGNSIIIGSGAGHSNLIDLNYVYNSYTQLRFKLEILDTTTTGPNYTATSGKFPMLFYPSSGGTTPFTSEDDITDNSILSGDSYFVGIHTSAGAITWKHGTTPPSTHISNTHSIGYTFKLTEAIHPHSYRIWPRNADNNHQLWAWLFQGGNDGTNWTTLDNSHYGNTSDPFSNGMNNTPSYTEGRGNDFSFNSSNKYEYFRLIVNLSKSGGDYPKYVVLGEITIKKYTLGVSSLENIMINNISRAIPVKPVSGYAGKVLKANSTGTGLEYGTISKITGSIVQTQHTIYRDTYTKSANGWEGLPFFVSITPSSINSKILISTTVHIGADSGTDSRWYGIRLYKKTGSGNFVNFTNIPNAINIDEDRDGTGDPEGTGVFMLHTWGAGSADYDTMVANVSNSYLDTPGTTSAVEYKLYWAARLGEGSPNSFTGNDRLLLNRSDSSTDAYRGLPVSFIQAQEIYIP
jgi:hypothetical protein